MTDQASAAAQRALLARMRSDEPRFAVALGGPHVVSDATVDAWADELEALLSVDPGLGAPPQHDDPSRCAVCGWTLASELIRGCVRGNCSQRPLPDRFYAPERAKREYNGHLDNDPRVKAALPSRVVPPEPPQHIIDFAIEQSTFSPCRSKRGVVIFDGSDILSHGYNFKPLGFGCDGSDECKATCRDEAVHAEQMALSGWRSKSLSAELLHVKTMDGALVASGGPSCVQCSKLILVSGIAAVWLYQSDGWHRYEANEFHRLSLAALAVQRRDDQPVAVDRLLRQARSASEGTTRSINDLGLALAHARETQPQRMSGEQEDSRVAGTSDALRSGAGGKPLRISLSSADANQVIEATRKECGEALAIATAEVLIEGPQALRQALNYAAAGGSPHAPQPPDVEMARQNIERALVHLDDAQLCGVWPDGSGLRGAHIKHLVGELLAAAHQAIPAPPPATDVFERVLKARSATTKLRDFARQHGMDYRERDPLVSAIHASIDDAEGLAPVSTPDASKEPS